MANYKRFIFSNNVYAGIKVTFPLMVHEFRSHLLTLHSTIHVMEMNESAECTFSIVELTKRIHYKREPNRPSSYIAAVADNEIPVADVLQQRGALILCLPKEIWLAILANYGLSAKDLVALEKTCRWFSTCLQGTFFLLSVAHDCNMVLVCVIDLSMSN